MRQIRREEDDDSSESDEKLQGVSEWCQRLEHEGLEVKVGMKIVRIVCVIVMCIIKNIVKYCEVLIVFIVMEQCYSIEKK